MQLPGYIKFAGRTRTRGVPRRSLSLSLRVLLAERFANSRCSLARACTHDGMHNLSNTPCRVVLRPLDSRGRLVKARGGAGEAHEKVVGNRLSADPEISALDRSGIAESAHRRVLILVRSVRLHNRRFLMRSSHTHARNTEAAAIGPWIRHKRRSFSPILFSKSTRRTSTCRACARLFCERVSLGSRR